MKSVTQSDRRNFLAHIAGAAALTTLGKSAWAQVPPATDEIGRKFYSDGRVHPFAGNTVICHLAQQGGNAELFRALLDIYREMPRHSFAPSITMLPPSSYHMTVFGCANDQDRDGPSWPKGLPTTATMAECHEYVGQKLKGFRHNLTLPIRMRVDLSDAPAGERPLKIRLLPVDERQERDIRNLRDRISDAVGIRTPNHDRYEFHITLAYLIRVLTPEQVADFRQLRMMWHEQLAKRVEVIELTAPEFCTFPDMFHFDTQFILS